MTVVVESLHLLDHVLQGFELVVDINIGVCELLHGFFNKIEFFC